MLIFLQSQFISHLIYLFFEFQFFHLRNYFFLMVIELFFQAIHHIKEDVIIDLDNECYFKFRLYFRLIKIS